MSINTYQWKEALLSSCRAFGVDTNPNQIELMAVYAAELLAWNQKTNLTAITDSAEVAEKHILDSLIPGKVIQSVMAKSEWSLLDIGSGGGFPGIPLKISMPEIRVTMVDSVRKKVNFLKYAIRALQLEGIDAVHARVEDLAGQAAFAGGFDVVISRAFTALDRFVALALPFVKPGGLIVAMKGKEVRNEIDAMDSKMVAPDIYSVDGRHLRIQVTSYTLPDSGSHRHLVLFQQDPGVA